MQIQERLQTRLVIVLCNVAGMVDLVALPIWVGSLMQTHSLSAQQAGFLVTAYILAIFASSLLFAPRLGWMNSRRWAALGFLVGAAAFIGLTQLTDFATMAVLHMVAGLGVGCGLTFTHGAIGRSSNPHRLFAMAGFGVALFAILFFAGLPSQIAAYGSPAVFAAFAALMLAAGLAAAVGFPIIGRPAEEKRLAEAIQPNARALAFIAVACLATTQAMIFSFIERAGVAHGFASQAIGIMLAIGGVLNLTAPIFATLLDRRVSHLTVAIVVLPLHALLGALALLAPSFILFAICGDLFVWMIIFGHNFMFSFIARLDPTGRTAAKTPAMLMIGSALGPILGGTLIGVSGYQSLAVVGMVVATIGTLCLVTIKRQARRSLPGIVAATALTGA